ncbi:MAG: hypothetical protein F6K53_35755 [Moorea sp. SIO4A1]|nr:hypothetical protein [Moorena sp. SIO4A1]
MPLRDRIYFDFSDILLEFRIKNSVSLFLILIRYIQVSYPDSRLPDSRLPTPDSRLPDSRLPTPDSRFPTPYCYGTASITRNLH